MIELIISSFFSVFIYFSFGLFLVEKNTKNLEFFTEAVIFGFISLSFIAITLNFFIPLNKNNNTIVSIIFVIASLFIFRRYYHLKTFSSYPLILSLVIILLIFGEHTYRPDAGSYHLPYTKILNNEKIVYGLSNLHFRFGHISVFQYLSAINVNIITKDNGIVFPSAILASATIFNFLIQIKSYLEKNNFSFHLYFLIIITIYICFKMNRYSEYGNDAPLHFFVFFTISYFLKNYSSKKNFIGEITLLSAFIFLIKPTMIMIFILPLYFFFKNKNFNMIKNYKIFFSSLILFLWICKNIIISGCIIYPLSFTCINDLKWTDIKKTKNISIENEAYAKNWSNYKERQNTPQELYIKNFKWLPNWLSYFKLKLINILLPYLIFINVLVFYLYKYSTKVKKIQIDRGILFVLIFTLSSNILWFLKIPLYRYGYSNLIVLISIIFVSIILSFKINKLNKIKKFLFIYLSIFLIIFFLKNVYRIISTEKYINYPFPRYYSHENDNIDKNKYKIIEVEKYKFFIPENGLCMYNKVFCTPYENKIKIEIINNFKFILN